MLAIVTTLLGLADPISKIAGKIADARIAAIHATTDKERIEQEERVKSLEARARVLEREADSKINQFVRAALAFPVIVFLWKVIIWDKVLAWGRTDDLSENLWYVSMIVIGFYFASYTVGKFKR